MTRPERIVEPARAAGVPGEPEPHDSALGHVTGAARYIDDLPEPAGTLHAALGLSDRAHADLTRLDLDAVRRAPGVVLVLTAEDLAHNDVSPTGKGDDPVLAHGTVLFHGQPIFVVIANDREAARRAVPLADITYADRSAQLDIAAAEPAGGDLVTEPLTLRIGDAAAAIAGAPHKLSGQFAIGGQDHLYLEGQIALAIPGEGDEMQVRSSTQHPSEVQRMVAHALDAPAAAVTVDVRRMGGAFGGKETQANLFAVVAAVAARATGRAVKLRLDRDEDMRATGKRHDFQVSYQVGFDAAGHIHGVSATYAARCGFSADLSGPVTDRALFHADNCYRYPAADLRSRPLRTNTVSNTAFRGFGGPQGMLGAERIIEEIAYATGQDTLAVRRANVYRNGDVTPYHQTIEDCVLTRLMDELEVSADYQTRRAEVLAFNRASPVLRRGISLVPVKFGISFTATWYNQAGALVHVYRDGSVHLNHGGTEMGQGLHTKVAQVVAGVFQIDRALVRITATSTGKVPNTSATAASSGTDLNAAAAADAAGQIRARLMAFAAEAYGVAPGQVVFERGMVHLGARRLAFADLVEAAYMARVHLSAAGFYKTPEIHWDRAAGRGRPFYYYAYGAAVSEAEIDTLTGETALRRVDILHDVGRSLNPALDLGQIEGGFIQGLGWLTSEELWWDAEGRLRTHAPSTYKIPLASDVPPAFTARLAGWSENAKPTVRRSKAVGEPPLMLAMSAFEAISMAVASVADYRACPRLDAPATPERVLMACRRLEAGA
ncbi:MAG: xanthine dehydrogenase molybdopterin binding subunit [Pseudomonadota bacterium]